LGHDVGFHQIRRTLLELVHRALVTLELGSLVFGGKSVWNIRENLREETSSLSLSTHPRGGSMLRRAPEGSEPAATNIRCTQRAHARVLGPHVDNRQPRLRRGGAGVSPESPRHRRCVRGATTFRESGRIFYGTHISR
jgi:hypothetical protein